MYTHGGRLTSETGALLQRIADWVVVIDYGIKFSGVTTFNNMDEGVQKLASGKIKADVFFPTIDVLGKLVAADLLQPLNHDLIPALQQDNWAAFQNPYYDQGWRYSEAEVPAGDESGVGELPAQLYGRLAALALV